MPIAFSDETAFHPIVERTSTREGNLTVVEVSAGILLAEERHPASTFKYRFTYTTRSAPELSKPGVRGARWFDKVKGFSGGAVKQSDIVGSVLSWELVPVKATTLGGTLAIIEPKCKIAVFTVSE
jgi:hypothetical protein